MHNLETTLAIIKPDAVKAGHADAIIKMIKDHGFQIVARQDGQWTKADAEVFYEIHKARPFFFELVNFMSSGPIVMLVLAKENAVANWRDLMGATNPAEAQPGTVRKLYGASIGENATHGSDSLENADREIELLFPELACFGSITG